MLVGVGRDVFCRGLGTQTVPKAPVGEKRTLKKTGRGAERVLGLGT
jgi:hypothetical protein